MQLNEVLKLKYPDANFLQDIILQDDGHGVYIKEWNLPGAVPTEPEIEQWKKDYDLAYRQKLAVMERKYPPLEQQLDMIFHDLQDGTEKWLTAIQGIKDLHPKPEK